MNSASNNVVALQPKVISRKEAIADGLSRYFTGKPCKRGHLALRRVSDSSCVTCISDQSRERAVRCKDEIQAYQAAYRLQNKDDMTAWRKEYYKNNREMIRARQAEYGKNNKAKRHAYMLAYTEANKARIQVAMSKRRKDNLPKFMLMQAKTRAKKRGLAFTVCTSDIIIPEFCPVFPWIRLTIGDMKSRDSSPSLDRIDNSKGYIPGNICVISGRANRLKGDASPLELQALLAYISRSMG